MVIVQFVFIYCCCSVVNKMKFLFAIFVIFAVDFLYGVNCSMYGYNSFVGMPYRLKRLHHRSAMFGEYYPDMMPFIPMTSFASGDTGISIADKNHEPENNYEETTQTIKTEIEQESPQEEEIATYVPSYEETSTQKTKVKTVTRKPKNHEEDSSEEEPNEWNGRRGYPPMNVYFPMNFGYPYQGFGGNQRSNNFGDNSGNGNHGGSGYPGVTSIANSFSNGKGGVATSHATAFGNAPPVHFYNNKRSQNNH